MTLQPFFVIKISITVRASPKRASVPRSWRFASWLHGSVAAAGQNPHLDLTGGHYSFEGDCAPNVVRLDYKKLDLSKGRTEMASRKECSLRPAT